MGRMNGNMNQWNQAPNLDMQQPRRAVAMNGRKDSSLDPWMGDRQPKIYSTPFEKPKPQPKAGGRILSNEEVWK